MFQGAAYRRADRLPVCILIAVYALSAAIPPAWLDRVGVVLCPFRALTGLPCPGCGMTHAFISIAHGNLSAAWHYNALSMPLFAAGLWWLAGRLGLPARPPRLSPRAQTWLGGVALAITLAYGGLRILLPSSRPW